MKYTLIVTALLLAASPLPSYAQAPLTDAAYVPAARCVAYAELTQLQRDAPDIAALKAAVEHHSGPSFLRISAREEARSIRLAANRAHGEDDLARLRTRRDQACAPFVSDGLVQAATASSPS